MPRRESSNAGAQGNRTLTESLPPIQAKAVAQLLAAKGPRPPAGARRDAGGATGSAAAEDPPADPYPAQATDEAPVPYPAQATDEAPAVPYPAQATAGSARPSMATRDSPTDPDPANGDSPPDPDPATGDSPPDRE
ncbi:MAG TPA: hypothetical protein VFD36_11585 [Kofleriaceae bacterium]|nr:hypothetical protein [Kofleriaceae bacterium]